MLNKRFKKRIKRRRVIEKRINCHGNTMHCLRTHLRIKQVEPSLRVPKIPVTDYTKRSVWSRFIRLFKKLWRF